jgi:hypothetical protein
MDPMGHIYEGTDEKPVKPEDAARLDGYVRGRAEAELLRDIKTAAYEAKVREMEEREGR